MNQSKPLIFISNDDGVDAPGLRHLIECVSYMGEVIAVAPSAPRSGQSSAITVDAPLRITPCPGFDGAKVYSVSGTPVDCVKLGLHALVNRKPDIMLSGVNHGSNSGNSVIYSGTMGAAMEACMVGIPAIGFSLLHHSIEADFSQTTPYIINFTKKVLENGLPDQVCLNVNIPAKCVPKGFKIVKAARGYWTEEYAEYADPSGKPFYWLTGRFVNTEPDNPDTDEYWLQREYVSVVPVRPDQTDSDAISRISDLLCR
ncbi:MAG: 5'/3'-nucleotidase SurE [Paramuribaculum sp.]|nr:5'/3'-nucleotidase SurE [Paramuribaculum sp.]